jgi:4-hydroxy-L-threonine phosphate dehydrogenase PdxA
MWNRKIVGNRARGKIDRRPYLGFTMGDPAGIGPEVLAKALARPEVSRLCRPLVIGSPAVMEQTVKALRLPLRIVEVPSYGHEATLGRRREVPVLDPLERPLRKPTASMPSSPDRSTRKR